MFIHTLFIFIARSQPYTELQQDRDGESRWSHTCSFFKLRSARWKEMPANNRGNLNYVKEYKPKHPEVQHLRILLYGPVGAGKSSFINSVASVLHGELTCLAETDGAQSEKTFTKEYRTYRFERKSDPNGFSINDIVGLEGSEGVRVDDIILALKGHVRDGYKFNPSSPLREGDEGYNPSPTLQDRVHVLVSVHPGDTGDILSGEMLTKMREIRLKATEMNIKQLAIITKCDKACRAVAGNMSNLYKCRHLKERAGDLCLRLGLRLNSIFLVKNYENTTGIKDDVDAPILCALRQIIRDGETFLNQEVMARAIRDYYLCTGYRVCFKPAGGIRTAQESLQWLALIKEELGSDWLCPHLFRIGASSLLADIERQLYHHITGRYASYQELPMA